MRARVIAAAATVALLGGIGGCGDTEHTTIIFGTTPTPVDGIRTATPARPIRTATPMAEEPTATPIGTGDLPTATPGATPGATVVATTTPLPTATPAGAIDTDVQHIAADIVPFLAHTNLLTGGSTSALTVGEALRTDDCPNGGTRVDDEASPTRTLTFDACRVSDQLGSFQFDGTVMITFGGFQGGSIAFDFTLTDVAANHAVAFLGTLDLTVDNDGFILDGPLAVSTPEGNFTLNADQVTITAARKVVAGSGSVSDDADEFSFHTVEFAVTRHGAASDLTVTFDDDSVHTYTLDLATGALTQTS